MQSTSGSLSIDSPSAPSLIASAATASTASTLPAAPNLGAKKSTKTSFFDIFLSEKKIVRNQKHARVIATIKAYAKIERELIEINKRLDNLISLLDVATGNGTKTLLEAAAASTANSINNCNTMIGEFEKTGDLKKLTNDQRYQIEELWKTALSKRNELVKKKKETFNRSKDIQDKLKKILDDYEKLKVKVQIIRRARVLPSGSSSSGED